MNLFEYGIILITLHYLSCMCTTQDIQNGIDAAESQIYIGVASEKFKVDNFEFESGMYCPQINAGHIGFSFNEDCNTHIFASKVYKHKALWVNKDIFYWADKKVYENDPFIDQNVHDSNLEHVKDIPWQGDIINDTFMFHVLSIDHYGEFKVVGCHETYHGICIVDISLFSKFVQVCPENESLDPFDICVKPIQSKSGVTAAEAMTLCQEDPGYRLQKRRIFTRFVGMFTTEKKQKSYLEDYNKRISKDSWDDIEDLPRIHFQNKAFDDKEQNFKFTVILCEYALKIPLEQSVLTLKHVPEGMRGYKNRLLLQLKGIWREIKNLEIACFTDSMTYYPTNVPVTWGNINFIDADNDGYYWCIAIQSKRKLIANTNSEFRPLTSNKTLFIKSSKATKDVKAYLIQFQKKMQTGEIMASIKRNFPKAKLKRLYKNNTFLVHSTPPIASDSSVKILYQRNLQQCENFQQFPEADIGKSVVDEKLFSTIYYTCMGDYNVGAFWKIVKIENKTTDMYSSPPMHVEQLEQINENLKSMVRKSHVDVDELENAMDDMNSVLILRDTHIPQRLTKNFENLLDFVAVPSNQTFIKIIKSNIAVLVARRDGPDSVAGIKVKNIGNKGIHEESIHQLTESDLLDPSSINSNDDIIAKVPSSICHGTDAKLSFTLFKDDAAFPNKKDKDWQVNSRVLSIAFDDKGCFKNSDFVDIYFRPFDNRHANTKACVHWDFDQGVWSTNICILLPHKQNQNILICRCYHLTHFAQIVTYVDLASKKELR